MKAEALILTNGAEIDQAKELGYKQPEMQLRADAFYFDFNSIIWAAKNGEGNIVVGFPAGDWILKFDIKLWNRIVTKFGKE